MANPQKENGTTQIANEIMDALCKFRIPGEVRQIIDVIIRKTYGWNKKSDWVANSQIVKMTGMLKGNVSRELSKAITHKLVIKSDNRLKLNKNYEEWVSFRKLSKVITKKVIKSDNKVIKSDNRVIKSDTKVIKSEGHKYTLTKDTNTKDRVNNIIPLFEKLNPFYKKFYSNTTERKSLQNIIDKYGEEWTINLIKKLPDIIKIPYAPPITSPYELEVKMGKLKIFLQQERGKNKRQGVTKV